MERTNKQKKIAVNVAGKVFFYTGPILKDEDNFILIEDCKEGLIQLNKTQIISIKSLEGQK